MMRTLLTLIGGLWTMAALLTACQPASTPDPTPSVTEEVLPDGLSPDEVAALRSLKRVDDHSLYTMAMTNDYHRSGSVATGNLEPRHALATPEIAPDWGCSLFASFTDPQAMLFGRNFDWETSPALLLFTRPSKGYASVSMVDIAYLGFSQQQYMRLDETPLDERLELLQAPFLPFDGMNDQGLVIGMAAVSPGNVPDDPNKPTIGSLGVIREMLDRAASVEEAVKILQSYNIDFSGGPPIHYLIADASQHAALVEFYAGKVIVIENETNWLAATNFLVAETGGNPKGWCSRYDRITERLSGGEALSTKAAMVLLESVSQSTTQWSVVYDYNRLTVQVAMSQNYDKVHTFRLEE
jgi:Acyl-coenzyme A:6-aminopenicillanic acid acyl-transferase